MTRRVRGAQSRLGGHALNSGTRSTMVVSMGGNASDSKVVDSKVITDVVTSKSDDTCDDKHVASGGGMIGLTCGAVDEGGVEVWVANGVDDVDGGYIVSCVDQPPARPPSRPPPHPPPLSQPLPQPQIGCILTALDDIGGQMDDPYDVDASSSCAKM